MSDPRAAPRTAPPPSPGSLPVRPLALWALLLPLSYAPALVVGGGFDVRLASFALAGTAIALAAVARLAAGRTPDRIAAGLEAPAPVLLVLACAGFAVVTVGRAVAASTAFDGHVIAGLFGQSFWTLLRGLPFANSAESVNGTLVSHFGVHFSPTLLVLAPFYAIAPHPLTLLAGQALALALVPVPLFALLRRRVGGAAALGLALLPFALPIFTRAGGGDFHDSSFLPAPLLAAVWALEARRPRLLALFAVVALGVREDAGLTVAALGVYALIRGRGVRTAAGLIALGLGWFAVATSAVTPAFGTQGIVADSRRFFEAAFGHWGATPGAVVRRWLSDPVGVVRWVAAGQQARYLYALALPFLLVPLLLDAAILAAVPGLALNVMSRFPFMHSAVAPYSYVPLTFMVLATAGLAARVAGRAPADRRSGAALVAAVIVLAGALPAGLASPAHPSVARLPPAVAREVVRMIPREAPVYAPEMLYAAMCNRERFDGWPNTGAVDRNAEFRARYAWFVLWPASDPAGEPRDAAMAESLAADPRFVLREGTAPLVVFERRDAR